MANIGIIAALIVVIIICIIAYYVLSKPAPAPPGLIALPPPSNGGLSTPLPSNGGLLASLQLPPTIAATNVSSTPPNHCHPCSPCTPGNCIYGCSKGIDYASASAGIRPGTPIMISDYRITNTDNETPDFVINGNQYWYRQAYDKAACTAVYTGSYTVNAITNTLATSPISTEVTEPGCWPGECKYKPSANAVGVNYMPNPGGVCDDPQQPNNYPEMNTQCNAYRDYKKKIGPGYNVEPILNSSGSGYGIGDYKGDVYFTDYPFKDVDKKFLTSYGKSYTDPTNKYWTDIN